MNRQPSQIVEHHITSNSLNDTITIMVYLPSNYSPLYTYPVLIAQDGQDYFKLGRLASLTDQLIDEAVIDDVIIVGIPYKTVRNRWEWYHPEGSQHNAYQRFLIYELIPFITDHYSIHPLASARILMGESLGGTISLLTALSYPYSVNQVIMQSPFINHAIVEKITQANHLAMLSVYHVIGTEETAVQTTKGSIEDFYKANQSLHKVLNNKVLSHYVYHELNGDHTWKTWQPNVEDALKTMLKRGTF